jgi:ABC-type Fe3+ transport system substrate-binding protein
MQRQRTGAGRVPYLVVLAVAFAVVLGTPFVLRPRQPAVPAPAPGVQAPRDLPQRSLIIVSPHNEAIRGEFERAFTVWAAEKAGFTVKIEWRDVGGSTQAIKYVIDQFTQKPDGIGVDVFFGGGMDPFLEFTRRGLLQPCYVPAEVLAPIPQSFAGLEVYDADKRWFGACLASFGIMYNRPVLEILGLPEPQTWADMGRPGYFTWIASADPRLSGSMHTLYEIILQAYGWDKGWEVAARMGANSRGFTSQAVGMAIDLYALRAVAEAGDDRVGFHLPQNLTVVNPDGIAMLKGAPNADVAALFIEFVLSEAGQKLWVLRQGAPGGPTQSTLYRLPVIPGFAARFGKDAAVTLDPFTFEGSIKFDSSVTSRRWQILNDLLGACIIDVQEDLAAAWKGLRRLPADDPRVRELFAAPISEDELMTLAGSAWGDPAYRAKTIARWSAGARERYRRLKEAD